MARTSGGISSTAVASTMARRKFTGSWAGLEAGRGQGVLQAAQGRPHRGPHRLGPRRGPHAAGRALEQGFAHGIVQALQGMADGRLRHRQHAGRCGSGCPRPSARRRRAAGSGPVCGSSQPDEICGLLIPYLKNLQWTSISKNPRIPTIDTPRHVVPRKETTMSTTFALGSGTYRAASLRQVLAPPSGRLLVRPCGPGAGRRGPVAAPAAQSAPDRGRSCIRHTHPELAGCHAPRGLVSRLNAGLKRRSRPAPRPESP